MAINDILDGIRRFRNKRLTNKQLVLILSLFTGTLAGLAAVILKNTVHYLRIFLTDHVLTGRFTFLYLIFPLVGMLITYLLTRYWIRENISHGISRILHSISQKGGQLKRHDTYSNLAGSAITVGFGGSVGLEAPIVLTGSAIGSRIGQFFHLEYKSMVLLIGCGAAGAISGIFMAPIAGVLFALEVLYLDLTMASLIPLLISSVCSATIAGALMGKSIVFSFQLTETYGLSDLPFFILLGIFCGLLSLYFTRANLFLEDSFSRIKDDWARVLSGGLLLSVLVFLIPPLFGEGYESLRSILSGQGDQLFSQSLFGDIPQHSGLFLLLLLGMVLFKVVAMSATTGAGGVGGVFAPTLFIGGLTGYLFAKSVNFSGLFQLSEKNFALVGMAGAMAGVMHAPLTAIFLIAELTSGYGLLIPLMITAAISFLTINYFEPHSVYSKRLAEKGQMVSRNKDKSILSQMKIDTLIETNFNTVNLRGYLGDLVKEVSRSQRNVFPVIDKDNLFQGVVFINDIRDILFKPELYGKVLIKDIMYMPDPLVELGESMEAVAKKFHDTDNYNLPVLDKGKYVGFVSRANVFSAYREIMLEASED